MPENLRHHICIVSLSYIARDARVLRQVAYLSDHYDITVIGFGDAPSQWVGKVDWYNVLGSKLTQRLELWLRIVVTFMGRFLPFVLKFEYAFFPMMRRIKDILFEVNADAYHANDWDTLPLVVPIATQLGAKIVFDAHEYSPGQQHSALRQFFLAFRATYFLKRFAQKATRMTTVSPLLAEKYAEVFGLTAQVIMSAPRQQGLLPSSIDADTIHLVHHGGATPRRHLELMIEMMRYANDYYHLHFYLITGQFQVYVNELKALAKNVAPERIHFYEPIAPTEITRTINQYDIGIFILKPNTFNHMAALPNKFFDFINAGLAVCISPTPGMASLARQYDFSVISETYEPEEIAQKLNALTPERIMEMKHNAYDASNILNADVEMGKVVEIYRELFSET